MKKLRFNKFSWLICAWLCAFLTVQAQVPEPASGPYPRILILGGVAHVGNGEVIQNAAIAIENGYFQFVKHQMDVRVDYSKYDTIIRLEQEHIYPGFIATNTTLGLTDVFAVRATHDFADVGKFNPNLRSLVAYSTDSRITPTIRTNGILLAQVTPSGGVISGTSSLMQLDGWNWQDAVVQADEGIHLRWPAQFTNRGWWAEPKKDAQNNQQDQHIRVIYEFFESARAYATEVDGDSTRGSIPMNLRLEAMRGLFNGDQRLYVHCNRAQEMLQVAKFKRDFNLEHVVVVGGYDAWLIPEVLKDQQIAVIYRCPHSLPMRPEDPIDLPYRIPKLMADTGIQFCLDMGTGTMEAMNQRNLPFLAGTAASYGLEKEQAVAAISGNTAHILGVEDKVGLLQSGLQATCFISTGDALDIRTNNVIWATVRGREIRLENHQSRMYERYRTKYLPEP